MTGVQTCALPISGELGISQALLSHYEKGLRECGLDFLIKLCDYYDVSSDYILGRTADRNGAVLSVSDLAGAETSKDSHFKGSVLPAMNKRLISSSLNILYDKLAKANNKELTSKVSDYIMLSIYRMFRLLYQSNKNNSANIFKVPSNVFEGYSNAGMLTTSSDISAILSEKSVSKTAVPAFEMTTENLTLDYPNHVTGLLNVIKTAEEIIK